MKSLLIALLALTCSCASDVHYRYTGAVPDAEHGNIEVVLSDSASNVTVTVNGRLVAREAHTSRVVVKGVPAGSAEVRVAAGGFRQTRVSETFHIEVPANGTTAVLVAAPEWTIAAGLTQLGLWVYAGLVLVALL